MKKLHTVLMTAAASSTTIIAVVVGVQMSTPQQDNIPQLHFSAPDFPIRADDELLNPAQVSYQSDSLGYTLVFPSNWDIDTSRTTLNGDIVSDPQEKNIITISEISNGQSADVFAAIIESNVIDATFTPLRIERLLWKEHTTLFIEGMRTIANEQFHVREYSILRPQREHVLTISITTKSDTEELYEDVLQHIVQSLAVE